MHVTALAQLYGVLTTARNHGRKQVLVLVKTDVTAVPPPDDVAALLERLTAGAVGGPRQPRRRDEDARRAQRHPPPRPHDPSSTAPRPGAVVGAAAPALDEDNLGNRMLRGMGWAPGTGLGTTCVRVAVPCRKARMLIGAGTGLVGQARRGRAFLSRSRRWCAGGGRASARKRGTSANDLHQTVYSCP
jgi:hypothetical protein